METTSTTQTLMLKKILSLIVFISLFISNSIFAKPLTTNITVGDFVFVDKNANGKQDAGEPGVPNVTVKLLNAAGTVLATTTTNSSGIYSLSCFITACESLRVQFGTSGQYTWTTKQAPGTTNTDNSNANADGLSDPFTLCPGEYTTCIDAGIIQSTAGTITVGDFVFVDQNSNGKQDAGEPGVAGVTVKLLNSAGTVLATNTTNASGIYSLNASITSCQSVRVQFGTPGQYTWTTKQAAGTTNTNNSNADVNGYTDFFTMCPGDYTTCIDAGIIQSTPGTITVGDFVFVDQNSNGKQDAGEPGVAGVTVKLLNSAGTVLATGTTNASGIYSLNASVTSCQSVRVQFGTPGQYTFTTKEAAGTTKTDNSNADANGFTDFFTMCPGDYTTCIDAGIIRSAPGTITVGDFVFIDQNSNGKQDAGEPGVPNVIVKLLNSAGTVLASGTTNGSGIYTLTASISTCQSLRVQFGNPAQYTFTAKNAAGTTAANNSDAKPDGFTDFFTLCPGDFSSTIDAGILPSGGPLAAPIQFKGVYANGVSQLSWSSTVESLSSTFEVERSTDGIAFKSITSDRITSKNISGNTYNFNDNLPLSGSNYYRLKITDARNSHYSNTVFLNVIIKGINITGIYPNPFINRIKVSVVSESAAPIKIVVSDYSGRIIKTQSLQGQKGSNEVFVNDLGSLGKGIYNLQVITGAQVKSIKLMKD